MSCQISQKLSELYVFYVSKILNKIFLLGMSVVCLWVQWKKIKLPAQENQSGSFSIARHFAVSKTQPTPIFWWRTRRPTTLEFTREKKLFVPSHVVMGYFGHTVVFITCWEKWALRRKSDRCTWIWNFLVPLKSL